MTDTDTQCYKDRYSDVALLAGEPTIKAHYLTIGTL